MVATTCAAPSHDDRLAGSYPFLTMCSVLTAGWLLERQARAASGDSPFHRTKRAAAAFFIGGGGARSAGPRGGRGGGAKLLYSVDAEALA